MAAFIASPLRLKEGFLRRTSEAEALVSLVEIMARTPHGSWPGCPSFGLRDYLDVTRVRPDTVQAALNEINRALDELGLTGYRAQSIQPEKVNREEGRAYALTFVSSDGANRTVKASVP